MNELLIRTPVGPLRYGDRFYFRRTTRLGRDQCGWVTARSVGTVADRSDVASWVNGTDDRGRVRSIRLHEITRIKHTADRRLSTKGARS